jgi:hypothetical protein
MAAVLNSCEASVLTSIDAAIGVDRLAVGRVPAQRPPWVRYEIKAWTADSGVK